MHPKTKNEKKFEQWLLQQYGMTKKEQRGYTLEGNLDSLWEIFSAADMVLLVKALPNIGKNLAKLGKNVGNDVAEEAIEKTVKKEAAEEMAESTAKKEVADTTEDLSQKTVDKDDAMKDSSGIKRGNESDIFKPPIIYKNKDGVLTNGKYTIDVKGMNRHRLNPSNNGKSQFLYDVDSDKAVLDAASYADEYNLWGGSDHGNKAKILVNNGPVGVVAETGELTNYINVYRTVDGKVHGSPASPPK